MTKKIAFVILTMLMLSVSAQAYVGEVRAAIDTPYVIVGIPRVLHLEVSVPKDASITWPNLQKQGGIRAVDMEHSEQSYLLEFGPDTNFSVDTLAVNDATITFEQNLQFFAFDSAAMVIKPIPFVVNGTDTLYSEVLALNCDQPFESIGDAPESMQGIKDILEPPFVWWDYLRWVVYSIGILLILALIGAAIYYLIRHYSKNGETKPQIAPEELQPAHVVAMNALLDLEQKHLWEGGHFKEYHTELTDILRHYLERRYQIKALESTTDEIMSELVELQIHQKSSYNNLQSVLKMADLVKFAKYQPAVEENQISFYNSRLFVEQTKEVVVEKKPGEAPETSESEKQTNTL